MKPDAFHQPARLPKSERQTILIAGASGLIGTAFTAAARAQGHEVRHLVRREPRASHEFSWKPAAHTLDPDALDGVDLVINLSGASISKMPWTKRYKEELRSSRIDSTQTLVTAINAAPEPPARFLSGSAVGIYGSQPEGTQNDVHGVGEGFLAQLTKEWEDEALKVTASTRVTLLRTGLVLASEGGMLPVVTRIAKLGGAGKLGRGSQHWPWISLDDYCAAVLLLMRSERTGPVNMTAPQSATAAEFMRTLAAVVHRPYLLPAPAFALRVILGEAADELLLSNQPVRPTQLLEDGFVFQDTNLRSTLERLLG